MSRKVKTNGSTALATVAAAPVVLQITRAEANAHQGAGTRAVSRGEGAARGAYPRL